MAQPLVPDVVWIRIEPLLPEVSRDNSKGGRPPVGDREVLSGILFVLKTGIPWDHLPQEMGAGSGMTCLRRLRQWQRIGVWSRMRAILSRFLEESDRINWARAERRSLISARRRTDLAGVAASDTPEHVYQDDLAVGRQVGCNP